MSVPEKTVLGILGGMGPAASCYLYQMLTLHTPAGCDQDHIDLLVSSRASTPDRTGFILGRSAADPYPAMLAAAEGLVGAGANLLCIACNTAHYFYDRLAADVPAPILHMPRLVVARAKALGCRRLGILATDGTVQAGVYQRVCEEAGLPCAAPGPEGQRAVMAVIYEGVKQGRRADMALWAKAVADLRARGCDYAVLGCTELSLVKRDEGLGDFYIDSTEVLCEAALRACGVEPVGF